VSPVRYELGSYIPEDDILHIRRSDNLKSYIVMNTSNFRDIVLCSPYVYRRFGGNFFRNTGSGDDYTVQCLRRFVSTAVRISKPVFVSL
jgi:hypothetical protein